MATDSTLSSPAGDEPSFKPFVSAGTVMPEFTLRAVVLGAFLGIIFGAVSVYLALRAGLTVSASIPVAVLSISIFKWLGNSTILENNIVQTVGSAGESIAAGTVFTLPALIFLGYTLDYSRIFPLALAGGLLGVLFIIPLRNALVVREHGNLTFPEGKACADVLVTGERGGIQAGKVFGGAGIGMAYKFLMGEAGGLGFWKAIPAWRPTWYPGATLSAEVTPEYLGVGYIIGTRVAGVMFAGGVLSWLVLIPIIKFFGSGLPVALFPGLAPINEMSASDIWSSYIRYIGAGAVTMAGIVTLARTFPTIITSFRTTLRQMKESREARASSVERTAQDLPLTLIVPGAILMVGAIWALMAFHINPHAHGNWIAAILVVIFGFFFATVSGRIVGLIGSSSNPVSGMTIATLLGTCLIFLLVGWTGGKAAAIALSVGAVVCIGGATAGQTMQDLKTGFLVGGTPSKQEIGYAIGVLTSVFVVGLTMQLLNKSATTYKKVQFSNVQIDSSMRPRGTVNYKHHEYETLTIIGSRKIPNGTYYYDPATRNIEYQKKYGIGSKDFPAPQATLMSVVINGILTRKLPWTLVLFGAFIALVLELCGVHSLAFAVGTYLPISTTAPIFAGGAVKWVVQKMSNTSAEESETGSGALFSSGLIAGGSLGGLALAAVVGFHKEKIFDIGARLLPSISQSDLVSLIIFSGLALLLFFVAKSKPAPASSK